ncbi:integrase catalytic domain-containing protein, partial [Trichonephila clavipes]
MIFGNVNSENNPADILSRGISPDKIQHCGLWWFGPPSLHQYKKNWNLTAVVDDLFLQELKETSDIPPYALLENFEPLDIIRNCSSFIKLQKIKAIHLEIVSDLITEAFFAILKRFVATRGRPFEDYSDNGQNFVGANNELRKILKAIFK